MKTAAKRIVRLHVLAASALLFLAGVIRHPAIAQVPTDPGTLPEKPRTAPPSKTHPLDRVPDEPYRDPPARRDVRVGLYENKPKVFTGDTGKSSGIFISILEDIARKEKWRLTYTPCSWSECLRHLEEGRIDVMPDVAFSMERQKKFDFHEEEVIESWSEVYVHPKHPLKRLADLNGRRIALLKGSIQQQVMGRMLHGFGYEASIVEADSYEEAFALAGKGVVDAVVANHFFGDYYYQEFGLKKTALVFNAAPLYFATKSGANADLLKAIDRHLRKMKSEPGSVFYRELARWMERPPTVVLPRRLLWALGGIGGLLALAFVVIFVLRREVRLRTRHLVKANETLRESEEKFRNLFHHHSAVKLIIDPDTGAIVEANAAAERFYGWSRDQLRTMRIQDFNALPPALVESGMKTAGIDQRTPFEFRNRLADGSIRDIEVFNSRIDIQGKSYIHSIVHDITDHRRLQEQVRQAQKMEAVGRLAGSVAHDFNNFLGVIIGYAEIALSRTPPEDPRLNDLKQILTAAEHSREITRQLLIFARNETNAPEVLDLNASVEGILGILRRLIGENIHLIWKPDADLWPVLMDASQFDQILTNLCVNARDAISDTGAIVIETGTATFEDAYCTRHAGFLPGDFVCISVSDSGRGMDGATLDKMFEPFFTTKKIGQGTGLGLATVYGIVKHHKGFIDVSSKPAQGTTFRIYLPRHAGNGFVKHNNPADKQV